MRVGVGRFKGDNVLQGAKKARPVLGEQDPIRSQSWRCARRAVQNEKMQKRFRAPERQKDGSEQRVQLP